MNKIPLNFKSISINMKKIQLNFKSIARNMKKIQLKWHQNMESNSRNMNTITLNLKSIARNMNKISFIASNFNERKLTTAEKGISIFLSNWEECEHADSFILITNQAQFRLVHDQKKIVVWFHNKRKIATQNFELMMISFLFSLMCEMPI